MLSGAPPSRQLCHLSLGLCLSPTQEGIDQELGPSAKEGVVVNIGALIIK